MGLYRTKIAGAASSTIPGVYRAAADIFYEANSFIFDFDSLLVASREFHQALLKRCLEQTGLSPSARFLNAYRSAAGRSYRTLVETIWKHEVSSKGSFSLEDFWALVVDCCRSGQFLAAVQAPVQPVEEVEQLLEAAVGPGVILSGSPAGVVEHLIEGSGLGRQLERYPLFSVFEHTDGKLKAGSIHPSIGKHLCGSVVALDDSLASARATLAGLGLRHAIVRAFEFSDRRERERHFDGNRIFEISSWSKLLKSRQVINRVKRPTVEFSNSDVAPQESRKEQQKRLANECLGIISRLGGVPGELLLGGGVSVALSCREFRSPSADFDFNIYLPGVPDIPGVLLASDDVRALSQSCSQPMSQSAKMSFLIEEGLRVDMIFVRRIPIGPWIVESRIDDYLRARALLSHVADRPILLVPREMVVFEKLLAARGLEVGKHDLFDVLSELEVSAPTGDVFRHLIQVQRIGTSEAYLVAGAGVRAKREAIIAELISRLGEVQLLCRGLHRDSELYSNYLKRMERQLVIDRSADLISFLKDLEADSAMMSHNSEGTSDCAALRIANDAGGLQ